MKKALSILLVIIFMIGVLSLTGCSQTTSKETLKIQYIE